MPIRFTPILAAGMLALTTFPVFAQEPHGHAPGASDHHGGLHFSHPIFTESISPDTKVRLDFARAWAETENESEVEAEAEYAFHESFSVEVVVPYVIVNPSGDDAVSRLGSIEVALKFANHAFDEHGLLLGYGIEVGLPTGNQSVGIGSDHQWELGPVLSLGLKRGPIEVVGRSSFGIPINQESGEEVETELAYDMSGLYHVSNRFQGLLEVNGDVVLSGEEAGTGLVRISPGIKFAPFTTRAFFLGVGVSIPLSADELDAQLRVSTFYHF